jgi:hypothetical protein
MDELAMGEIAKLRVDTALQRTEAIKALKRNPFDAKWKGKAVGELILCLMAVSPMKLQRVADKNQQIRNNVLLAFALAWYHADHDRYPKELAELSPNYLAEVPQDIFSGKPLIYRPTKDGYLLYSVGPNGQDDGGRSYDDEGEPRGDDIVVRMPLPALPKK